MTSNATSDFQRNATPPLESGFLIINLFGECKSMQCLLNPSLSNLVSIKKHTVGVCFLTNLWRLRTIQRFLSPWQFQINSLIVIGMGDPTPLPFHHSDKHPALALYSVCLILPLIQSLMLNPYAECPSSPNLAWFLSYLIHQDHIQNEETWSIWTYVLKPEAHNHFLN